MCNKKMLTTPVTAFVPFLLKVEGSLWYHGVMLRYRHNIVAFPSKVTEVQMQSVHAKFCHIVDCLQSDTRMKLYRVILLPDTDKMKREGLQNAQAQVIISNALVPPPLLIHHAAYKEYFPVN